MGTTRASKDTGLAPLACTQCRSQHLKCDGRPTCSRCAHNGMKCQYIPSRRGGRRKPATPHRPPSVDDFALVSSPGLPLGVAGEDMASSAGDLAAPDEMSLCGSAGPSVPGKWRDDDDRLLRLFYEHFHIAHPILVPSSRYHGRRYPIFLQLVIHFIGSHYTPSANVSSQRLKERVVTALTPDVDRTPCLVQAWLLFSIALYARGEWSEARDAFDKSLDLALDLGMNRWAFATSAQPQTPTEAESMRRTWWELYVTDIIMAIPQRDRVLRCSKVVSEAGLPCEESRYGIDDGNLGSPHRLLDFKHRVFAAEETVFSSFSYRIEAATIMCQVLILNRLKDPHRDQLQAVENALVSWVNHLPQSKMEFIDVLGNVDEMMFQAHTITAYSAMLLHLPRSDLSPLLPLPDDHLWPRMPRYHASPSRLLIHSIKAIEASRRLSDFISVCPNTLKHSPFLFSAMALCGMLQVATTKAHPEDCLEHHYNRVTLILGCLRSSKRTWKLAGLEYERVRLCAVEHMKRAIEKLSTNSPASGLGDGNNTSDAQVAPEFQMSADISLSTTPAGGQDGVLSDIMLGFIDPTCNNPSFFSSFTDFEAN